MWTNLKRQYSLETVHKPAGPGGAVSVEPRCYGVSIFFSFGPSSGFCLITSSQPAS